MVKPLAPIVAKLSFRLLFMASIAVIMPMRAIIPKAIIDTVIPVRSLLLTTVLYACKNESFSTMMLQYVLRKITQRIISHYHINDKWQFLCFSLWFTQSFLPLAGKSLTHQCPVQL